MNILEKKQKRWTFKKKVVRLQASISPPSAFPLLPTQIRTKTHTFFNILSVDESITIVPDLFDHEQFATLLQIFEFYNLFIANCSNT